MRVIYRGRHSFIDIMCYFNSCFVSLQIHWKPSSIQFVDRFDKYLDPNFFQHRVSLHGLNLFRASCLCDSRGWLDCFALVNCNCYVIKSNRSRRRKVSFTKKYMLLIVWISIPFDLLWWEQFIAILSLKSVTCEVCRLAASLQNRILPEINSLSYMPHVALYELFMDCFHEWHLYLLHGLKEKYADVSVYLRAGLFSANFYHLT